jgi:hypothetical protein
MIWGEDSDRAINIDWTALAAAVATVAAVAMAILPFLPFLAICVFGGRL